MKKLVVFFVFAAALCVSAFAAGRLVALDAPIDCAHYVAGGGVATNAELLSINYETGEVRFRLLNASGVALGNAAVFGVTLSAPVSEASVKAAVAAAIAAAG
jgi:hypothetical protein